MFTRAILDGLRLDVDHNLRRRQYSSNVSIEALESRTVLSSVPVAGPIAVVPSVDPTDVLDNATDLGTLQAGQDVQIPGEISRGTEVDWYRFTLSTASSVEFSASSGVLGLYNNAVNNFGDLLTLGNNRLLVQSSSTGTSPAEIQRELAPGTYFVAVSGNGNRDFSSTLADSGLSGDLGTYTLDITPTLLSLPPSSGAIVLATDISPLSARIDFSQALGFDPTVQLLDAAGNVVPVNWVSSNNSIFELQIAPTQAFAAGTYQAVVSDANGNVRMTVPLDVSGAGAGETGLTGNDTPSSAIELGDIENQGLLQIAGTIGDDPFYDSASSDPSHWLGNDVDLYHFTVTSATPIGLQAEIFSGRINSNLDSALSLYRLDPVTGHLQFVAANNNTSNAIRGINGSIPLAFDSALAAGLSAGDYYVAVSQGRNAYSPAEGQTNPSSSQFFNPELAHSGSAGLGTSVGAYVLNLRVIPIPDPPEVTTVSIANQSQLPGAPSVFSVQFSEFVNLTQLANSAFTATTQSSIAAVYVQDAQGHKFFPRLTSFDSTTLTASFTMLDRLPAGSYQLHLDGSQGLTNITGAALVGNSNDGTYVVHFTVAPSNAGTNNDPLTWTYDPTSNDAPQQLGVLFPEELVQGVTIERTAGSGHGSTQDSFDQYSFQILQNSQYALFTFGTHLPAGLRLQILNSSGIVVIDSVASDSHFIPAVLSAGTYTLRIGNWSGTQSHSLAYRIELNLGLIPDNPPPLYSGPAPAVGIRLVTAADSGIGSGGLGSSSGTSGGISTTGPSGGFSNGASGNGASSSGDSNSTVSSSSTTSYLVDRQGLLKINLPANADGVVIAIPTASGGSLDRSGLLFQATRSSRRGSDLRDSLSLSGLGELADGPAGQTSSESGDSASTLKAMHKLLSLIESAFSSKAGHEISEDQKSDSISSEDIDATTAQLREAELLENGINFDESSVMTTTPEAVSPFNEITREGAPVEKQPQIERHVMTDRAFFSDDENLTSTIHFDTIPQDPAYDSGLTFSPDTLFASGIGLLLLDSAIRSMNSPTSSSVRSPGSRASMRLARRQPQPM
jgi:hypothetical protein